MLPTMSIGEHSMANMYSVFPFTAATTARCSLAATYVGRGAIVKFYVSKTMVISTVRFEITPFTGTGPTVRISIEEDFGFTSFQQFSPYDSNAVVEHTIVSGINVVSFTNLTVPMRVGKLHCLVFQNVSAGTVECYFPLIRQMGLSTDMPTSIVSFSSVSALRGSVGLPNYPSALMLMCFELLSGEHYTTGMAPYYNIFPNIVPSYGTTVRGGKFNLLIPATCSGITAFIKRTGTEKVVRLRLIDSTNALVPGFDYSFPLWHSTAMDSSNIGRRHFFPVVPGVALQPGVYRVIISCPTGDISNHMSMGKLVPFTSSCCGTQVPTVCTGTSAGNDAIPTVWTDTTDIASVEMFFDSTDGTLAGAGSGSGSGSSVVQSSLGMGVV
jgi:hypothetical protein